MDGSSEKGCGGMTEEVRVLSLFSHDGADDEDDYFLCAKKAEAEELYLSLTFVIGCGQKAREHRMIELRSSTLKNVFPR